ncbi:MAG TPA: signal peptidase II [Polyangiaceae bacterium]|nr:signal peptidase II [Polyangiaceae bacterium]
MIRARWQQLALPAGLIAVDLLSKAWAVAWLKADQPVDVDAGLQWVLRVNREGLGSWSRALAFAADARVAGAVLYAGFALAFLAFQRGHWTKWQKVAILALIFVTSPFLGITLNLVIPSLSTPLLTRLCGAALFGVLWWLSKPGLWRWATAFMVSAGLGNSLGLLVHGEGIVDFIYSRWMTSLLNMGVFNIADLYFNLAALCLTAWLGRWAARNAANATTRLLRPAGA